MIFMIALLSLFQVTISTVIPSSTTKRLKYIIAVSPSIYTLLEFILLQVILCSMFNIKWFRKTLTISISLSTLILFLSISDSFEFIYQHFDNLILATGLCMLFFCFLAFHLTINTDSINSLKTSYEFWFITAIFFLYSISLPLYFFRDFLYKVYPKNREVAILGILGITYYIIFFQLLFTASRCKVRFPK
jgi:hypothetical protein